jgi:hypothetical protein
VADSLDEPSSQAALKPVDRESAEVQQKKELQTSGALERRIPCDEVISGFDRASAQSERPIEIGDVARQLKTSTFWVERCMNVYGRRPRRVAAENSEETEQRLESLEEDEPEETAPEDVEEEGVRTRPERPERQKVLHGSARAPTPGANEGYGD